MFYRIRKFIGWYNLKRDLSKIQRERRIFNFQEAKKIGIIYYLDDVHTYDTIASLVTRLQQDHKEVKALGYVRNKELITRFLPKLVFDFFSPRDLNFFYKPTHPKVNDFISTEFDILIDLGMDGQLPLKYISGFSFSHCRVGRYSAENVIFYDLMLDVTEQVTLTEFIEQVIHYLKIINKNEK